jgi:hypothetical protein
MATTPNFNWVTPDNTGLVKNGALDIRTLGDAIDSSLVDLKGGTTGQVLKKATNTDMDFVWSADSAGMTNPMTTTGDTIYSSSGSTPARLGIGSTGQVLTVASGLPSWATPAGGGGLTVIGTGTLSGSSVVVSSIPSTYKHLMVSVYGMTNDSVNNSLSLRYNSVTTNYINGTYGFFNTTASNGGAINKVGWTLNEESNDWLRTGGENHANWIIYDYTSTTGMINAIGSCNYKNSASTYSRASATFSNQASAAAITSLTIRLEGGQNMTAGTYTVYGVS